ncbi:hypothetical protein DB354_07885 [Opitutus sp. ER46]|nr:hypothetical protein DB354_07885 [Opitutus sp. ER46]
MAFFFATCGANAFPGCETMADVCARLGVSERTMQAHLEALRIGFRLYAPRHVATDLPVQTEHEFAGQKKTEESE